MIIGDNRCAARPYRRFLQGSKPAQQPNKSALGRLQLVTSRDRQLTVLPSNRRPGRIEATSGPDKKASQEGQQEAGAEEEESIRIPRRRLHPSAH